MGPRDSKPQRHRTTSFRSCPGTRPEFAISNPPSPEVSAVALNRLFNPLAVKRSWYRLLGLGSSSHSFFLKTTAAGSIAIDKLRLGSAMCTRFSADVVLEKAKVPSANGRGKL